MTEVVLHLPTAKAQRFPQITGIHVCNHQRPSCVQDSTPGKPMTACTVPASVPMSVAAAIVYSHPAAPHSHRGTRSDVRAIDIRTQYSACTIAAAGARVSIDRQVTTVPRSSALVTVPHLFCQVPATTSVLCASDSGAAAAASPEHPSRPGPAAPQTLSCTKKPPIRTPRQRPAQCRGRSLLSAPHMMIGRHRGDAVTLFASCRPVCAEELI